MILTEAQRAAVNEAIAEACGWRAEQWSPPNDSWYLLRPDGERAHHPLDSCGTKARVFEIHAPNFCEDLNAVALAEKALLKASDDILEYLAQLVELCPISAHDSAYFASATQRSIALVRALNLKVEGVNP